jgi:hypothetical protein
MAAVHGKPWAVPPRSSNNNRTSYNIFINSLYATLFIQRTCVLLKNTTCFGTFQPSSGVISSIFITLNILKAIPKGHPTHLRSTCVAIMITYKNYKLVKNFLKLVKISFKQVCRFNKFIIIATHVERKCVGWPLGIAFNMFSVINRELITPDDGWNVPKHVVFFNKTQVLCTKKCGIQTVNKYIVTYCNRVLEYNV